MSEKTEAEIAIADVVYWNKILDDAKKYQAIEDALKTEPELEKAIERLLKLCTLEQSHLINGEYPFTASNAETFE